jgi:CRP-like cAMP-binding protein
MGVLVEGGAMPERERRTALRGVELFSGLNDRQLGRLAKRATQRRFPAGSRVLRRGDAGVALYVILTGRIVVSCPCPDTGQSWTLGELGPGQVFGEVALIDGGPRSADVDAVDVTDCLVLTRWDFGGELAQDPDLARALLPILCRRIRSLQAQLIGYQQPPSSD